MSYSKDLSLHTLYALLKITGCSCLMFCRPCSICDPILNIITFKPSAKAETVAAATVLRRVLRQHCTDHRAGHKQHWVSPHGQLKV